MQVSKTILEEARGPLAARQLGANKPDPKSPPPGFDAAAIATQRKQEMQGQPMNMENKAHAPGARGMQERISMNPNPRINPALDPGRMP